LAKITAVLLLALLMLANFTIKSPTAIFHLSLTKTNYFSFVVLEILNSNKFGFEVQAECAFVVTF